MLKTPFDAVEKSVLSKAEPCFELKPEIFYQTPKEFKNKILNLKQCNKSSFHKQRCET